MIADGPPLPKAADLFLSPSELEALTGYRDRHHQARWLERNRWHFAVDCHNRPRVARGHFEARMGCGRQPTPAERRAVDAAAAGPNWDALRRR